ncbi:MAG: class I SAM-dependent methyltransferase [Bacteroidia bacterium]|nr:class I SAM-dependent methyltransferase [Bacteroidia bacterium]
MEHEWYKSWFNSEFYPILYRHRNDEEAARFITALLHAHPVSPGSRILDAPCGNGRHGRMLAGLGFSVTGIDLSEEAILSARERSSGAEEYLVQDMRCIFRTNYYDMVLNIFSSFGYGTVRDDRKILQNFYHSLKPKGLLVLDFLNTAVTLHHLVPEETTEREGIRFTIRRRHEHGKIIKQIQVAHGTHIFHFCESITDHSPVALEQLLKEAGFIIHARYGDYSLEEFSQESSPRIIFVTEKS